MKRKGLCCILASVTFRPMKETGCKSLKQLRKALGLSRAELAVKVGVTYVTIYRWEETTGIGGVRLDMLEKIAQVLDVPVAALLPRERA